MGQSVHTREYACFLRLLREAREKRGFTQVQLSAALGISQSHLSKLERGELRMDIVQLRNYCQAIGVTLAKFIKAFEAEIED